MMQIFAATVFLGTLVLFVIPETKCQTLEILVCEVWLGTSSSSRTGKGGLIARLTWWLYQKGHDGCGQCEGEYGDWD
jgi:hypothetical protein